MIVALGLWAVAAIGAARILWRTIRAAHDPDQVSIEDHRATMDGLDPRQR